MQDFGLLPVVAQSVAELEHLTSRGPFRLTIIDISGDDGSGLEALRRSRRRHDDPGPLVVLADGTDVAHASKADLLGADEILVAPWTLESIQTVVKTVLNRPRASARDGSGYDDAGVRLRQEIALWRSPKMRDVWTVVQQAAGADITVLIGGETGTGKELVARAVHQLSTRRDKPFIKVNCAAVPAELLESELFGHERGAFTGAHQLRVGNFEAADQGVVFLDEIGDLHLSLQAKLLHVLEDGAFSRVGGRSTVQADVRIVAATNRSLEIDVVQGRFREDLYYRLNVIQIVVPPLRERVEEIPLLLDYFLEKYAKLFQRERFTISPTALDSLLHRRYPGNVRELENIVKRMIALNDPMLTRSVFPSDSPHNGDGGGVTAAKRNESPSLKEIGRAAARMAEREAISRVLRQTHWNRVRAAKLLRISYRALLYKIKDAGLYSEQPSMRSREGTQIAETSEGGER